MRLFRLTLLAEVCTSVFDATAGVPLNEPVHQSGVLGTDNEWGLLEQDTRLNVAYVSTNLTMNHRRSVRPSFCISSNRMRATFFVLKMERRWISRQWQELCSLVRLLYRISP